MDAFLGIQRRWDLPDHPAEISAWIKKDPTADKATFFAVHVKTPVKAKELVEALETLTKKLREEINAVD